MSGARPSGGSRPSSRRRRASIRLLTAGLVLKVAVGLVLFAWPIVERTGGSGVLAAEVSEQAMGRSKAPASSAVTDGAANTKLEPVDRQPLLPDQRSPSTYLEASGADWTTLMGGVLDVHEALARQLEALSGEWTDESTEPGPRTRLGRGER